MSHYIADLYEFLEQLTANNNRQWFEDNRPRYEHLRALWMADIERLIASMSAWEPGMASQTAKTCVYRIYRDTRFSHDKTPYKTFFSAAFSPWGRKAERAGYYLELGLGETHQSGLYGGIWCMESAVLKKLRHAIVDNIEEWESIVNEQQMLTDYPSWCSSMLKISPKGWDRNHPQAFYLRMTNYGKWHPCSRDFFLDPAWPEHAAALFHTLKPFVDFINYSIDE